MPPVQTTPVAFGSAVTDAGMSFVSGAPTMLPNNLGNAATGTWSGYAERPLPPKPQIHQATPAMVPIPAVGPYPTNADMTKMQAPTTNTTTISREQAYQARLASLSIPQTPLDGQPSGHAYIAQSWTPANNQSMFSIPTTPSETWAGPVNHQHPWTHPNDPNMSSVSPVPSEYLTGYANPTHVWTPPNDTNIVSPVPLAHHLGTTVETAKPHRCKTCGKRFKYRQGLCSHSRKCEPEVAQTRIETETHISTPPNNANMMSHTPLDNHTEASVDKGLPYPCEACGRRYSSLRGISRHSRFCKSSLALQGREDTGQTSPMRHDTLEEIPIENNKPYHCETCGRSYTTPQSLKRHLGDEPRCNSELALRKHGGVDQTPATSYDTPMELRPVVPVGHEIPQSKDESDPRMSNEPDATRNEVLKCQRILLERQPITAKETWDEPGYFWNHRAYCHLEARLCATRLGLSFPVPERLGHADSNDKSIRGLVMCVPPTQCLRVRHPVHAHSSIYMALLTSWEYRYPLFRLAAMGEDTPNNISLFLGPRWDAYRAEVVTIYHSMRISVLLAGFDLETARKNFQKWDDQKWNELTAGMPR